MNRIEHNRGQSLQGVAYKLEMEYNAYDEFGLYSLLRGFKLFKRGSRRKLTHLISSTKDLETKTYIFDYKYIIGSNKNRKIRNQTVLFLNSKKLGLPEFSMKPEQLWHKLTTWLKLESDIDFEENLDFSDNYLLKGEDEEIVRFTFTPEVLNFFSIHKNWHIEGTNYYLIFYSHNERFHPDVIPGFHRMGKQLLELFEVHPDALKLD